MNIRMRIGLQPLTVHIMLEHSLFDSRRVITEVDSLLETITV